MNSLIRPLNPARPIISRLLLLAAFAGFLFAGSLAQAQNMQVIGGNSVAQECYRASVAAALSGMAGSDDVDVCDKAIHHGALKRKDLIATYVNRGVIHMAAADYKRAARDYNRALELNPDVAEAYVNRGNLWFMANRYKEAIADYDRSLELGFAQPHVALLNRGMVYEITGKYQNAREDYLAALDKVEDWPVALEKLARVNRKLEK